MKTLKLLQVIFAALLSTMTFSVSAATLDLANSINYSGGGPPGPSFSGSIADVVNINDYMPGASSGYYLTNANPNAVSSNHLQTAFDAKGVDFTVTGFTKIEGDINSLDTSSLGIAFEGFLMKVGNFTMVGLFDTAITSLIVSNMGLSGISHIAYFNTSDISAIPIPAALWLFGPALLGFMGFRRRLSK